MQQVLDRTDAQHIGSYPGVDVAPPAGSVSTTVTADMAVSSLADSSNHLRVDVEADFGVGWQRVKTGAPWQGGANQTAPATTYSWDINHPPLALRGVLVNGTAGSGSAVDAGLLQSFS